MLPNYDVVPQFKPNLIICNITSSNPRTIDEIIRDKLAEDYSNTLVLEIFSGRNTTVENWLPYYNSSYYCYTRSSYVYLYTPDGMRHLVKCRNSYHNKIIEIYDKFVCDYTQARNINNIQNFVSIRRYIDHRRYDPTIFEILKL